MAEEAQVTGTVDVNSPTGKFYGLLKRTNKQIREDRGINIAEDAEAEFRTRIEKLRRDYRKLERERANSLDLSPTSTTSMELPQFDATQFVSNYITYGINLRNLEIQIEIAEKSYLELFGAEVPKH